MVETSIYGVSQPRMVCPAWQFMIHYMTIICFYIHTNDHKSLTNFSKIFLSFCECLGTFSRFPVRQEWFFYLFPKRSVFLLSLLSPFADTIDCRPVWSLRQQLPSPRVGRGAPFGSRFVRFVVRNYFTSLPGFTSFIRVVTLRSPSKFSAERIMPWLSTPMSLRGARLAMNRMSRPMSSSGW